MDDIAKRASEYPVAGGNEYHDVERNAARTALLTNIPQTFEFNGERYVVDPKEAAQYFSKKNLREYIKQMREEIGLLAGVIFRYKLKIRKEIAFGRKIHGKTFKP